MREVLEWWNSGIMEDWNSENYKTRYRRPLMHLAVDRLATVSPSIAGLTDASPKDWRARLRRAVPPASAVRTAHCGFALQGHHSNIPLFQHSLQLGTNIHGI